MNNRLADVTKLLFALHWRTLHGPAGFRNRILGSFSRHLPGVSTNRVTEGAPQLRQRLLELAQVAQRQLVYAVTRDAMGSDEWARHAPRTEPSWTSDPLMWEVLASCAINVATADPQLAHRAACARGVLNFGGRRGSVMWRAALAELLAPYDVRAAWLREELDCLIRPDQDELDGVQRTGGRA